MSQQEKLAELCLGLMPADGKAIGNQALREKFLAAAAQAGLTATDAEFDALRESLIANGILAKGKGRGGSVHLANPDMEAFDLAAQEVEASASKPTAAKKTPKPRTPATANAGDAQIISYRHGDKRKNNPEVGMVKPENDPAEGKTRWAYDPHLDPALQFDPGRAHIEQLIDDALARGDTDTMHAALAELKRLQSPYLNWAGKAEGGSFDVDTVSLHVHERIDPASILAVVRKRMKGEKGGKVVGGFQPGLFDAAFENLPLRDAIDFYKHEKGWSNRLVAGDSLLVMNSLLHKEGMAGQVQMVFIDPPYGIKYGSNFQPFTNKRDVKDRKDEDLTQEPEMIKAFRDTWELGIHSYLTYLRDRLLLAKELLNETGSVFVQISDENVHHVRELMDEVFGDENFCALINFVKNSGQTTTLVSGNCDYLLWYGRNKPQVKFRRLFYSKAEGTDFANRYDSIELKSGRRLPASKVLDETERSCGRLFALQPAISAGFNSGTTIDFHLNGKTYHPGITRQWKYTFAGMSRLNKANRLVGLGTMIYYPRYLDDFPAYAIGNNWADTQDRLSKDYVVQTVPLVIERCMLMTTDPGDLVLDPTCGSGTTAFAAEKWGRRWITCDTSRVSVTLAKQRLMTASFDYYELRYPHEGLKGGFIYKTVPHVMLKSIANNPEIDEIFERMHPAVDAALADLNKAVKKSLKEWEIPFDFAAGWP